MAQLDVLSPLEDATEDGDWDRFLTIIASENYNQEDLVDSMDTAYRGSKLNHSAKSGCIKIMHYLEQCGLTIPSYVFNEM